MSHNEMRRMTKPEIAEFLGDTLDNISRWAQSTTFGDWLDVCPKRDDRVHDQYDVRMFQLISQLNRRISETVPFGKRVGCMKSQLCSSPEARRIRDKRRVDRARREVARWTVFGPSGPCLMYEYEWLKPLAPSVDYVVDFGCWVSDLDAGTSSEAYALLWTLEAARVVVVDRQPKNIENAQSWLETAREEHPYFRDYDLLFVVGDMTNTRLPETTDALEENGFDLSYCRAVLCNMYASPTALKSAIDTMASVVKPGGWVIAMEPRMGVEHEQKPCDLFGGKISVPVPLGQCRDIGRYFEAAGLVSVDLDGAPGCSYCYQKPLGQQPC